MCLLPVLALLKAFLTRPKALFLELAAFLAGLLALATLLFECLTALGFGLLGLALLRGPALLLCRLLLRSPLLLRLLPASLPTALAYPFGGLRSASLFLLGTLLLGSTFLFLDAFLLGTLPAGLLAAFPLGLGGTALFLSASALGFLCTRGLFRPRPLSLCLGPARLFSRTSSLRPPGFLRLARFFRSLCFFGLSGLLGLTRGLRLGGTALLL